MKLLAKPSNITLLPAPSKSYWFMIVVGTLLLAVVTLSPNPFGNIADVIADESYFVSSALAAIVHHTLPGFDFSASGAYYGGLQTYLVTIAVALVLLFQFIVSGFSSAAVSLFVATHTGDLDYVSRLVNGLFFVVLATAAFWWTSRRRDAEPLHRRLILLLLLLVGNSLFMSMVHTGKVWTMQACLELAAAFVVAAREYVGAFKHPRTYLYLLIAITFLAASQTVTGIFTGLWILYALYLRHVTFRDLSRAVLVSIPFILVGLALEASILTRAWHGFLRISGDITNINGTAVHGSSVTSTLLGRALWPIVTASRSAPVAVLAYVVVVLSFFSSSIIRKGAHSRAALIGLVHPLFTWGGFYLFLGLGTLPRLALPMTLGFSTAAFFSLVFEYRLLRRGLCMLAVFGAVVVGAQIVWLWYRPASEKLAREYLESAYHDPKNAIMVHYPRFTLPPNNESLDYVSGKEKTFGRYSYLLEHRKELAAQTAHDSFHAVVIRQLSTSTDYLSRLKNFHLVEFETGCDMLCSAHSLRVCREFNTSICAAHLSSYAHEIPTLDSLLRIQRLGRPIIIWERQ